MAFDAEFHDGADKYGPVGLASHSVIGEMLGAEWTSDFGGTYEIVNALAGVGQAIKISGGGPGINTIGGHRKALGGNYARIRGNVYISSPMTVSHCGIVFDDNGVDQLTLQINYLVGTVTAVRGTVALGTALMTSAEAIAANVPKCISFDVECHNSTGRARVWFDGVLTTLDFTGNTRASGNNWFNGFRIGAITTITSAVSSITWDHLQIEMFTAAGGGGDPLLTLPQVGTTWTDADSAVDFTPGAGVLGQAYRTTLSSNAPGANQLVLRQFTPQADCTLDSISFMPFATSAGAKCKGVAYADSAGAPGSLLSSGTEVVGLTSGTAAVLPLVTPQALVAGTPYWIGYITDTSVAIGLVDATSVTGAKASNTYASGAPGSAPAMTGGQPRWMIYGRVSGIAENWSQLDENPPLGDLSFNSSSSVGDTDLLAMQAPTFTAEEVYSVAVKANGYLATAGGRRVDMQLKSGATTDAGDTTSIPPGLTPGWNMASYFRTDPNTGLDWDPLDAAATLCGYKIVA